MRQVLFEVPFLGLPIFGYGLMLFFAFVFTTVLACWLGNKKGLPPNKMQDLCITIFLFGVIGGRATHIIAFPGYETFWDYFKIWKGGLVFYGGAIGGAIGYFVSYWFILRKYKITSWQIADIAAPCAALGLAIGRIGCLLNGCCYGNVACPECPAITFPMSAPPRTDMVYRGYQTPAGFTLLRANSSVVGEVAPDSPAEKAGLKPGDMIVKVNDRPVEDIHQSFQRWQQGVNEVKITVRRAGQSETITLPAFSPRTIGLHPTQIYETISMMLLFYLLMAYMPFAKRDGMVMVLFMVGYSFHRFVNESLRTDTPPLANGLTLSQNISVAVLAAGILLFIVIQFRPIQKDPQKPPVSSLPNPIS